MVRSSSSRGSTTHSTRPPVQGTVSVDEVAGEENPLGPGRTDLERQHAHQDRDADAACRGMTEPGAAGRAGHSVSGVRAVRSVAEIVDRLADEYAQARAATAARYRQGPDRGGRVPARLMRSGS